MIHCVYYSYVLAPLRANAPQNAPRFKRVKNGPRKLVKLLNLMKSNNDHEALVVSRKVNAILEVEKLTWEQLFTGPKEPRRPETSFDVLEIINLYDAMREISNARSCYFWSPEAIKGAQSSTHAENSAPFKPSASHFSPATLIPRRV